jgi:dihydroorotase
MANVPIMVDYGPGHSKLPLAPLLRSSEKNETRRHLHPHLGPAKALLDERGNIRPEFLEARQRGIIFDVGHGEGSFLCRQAEPAIQKGFVPDSISTDLHAGNINGGVKDILTVMSKLLNIGMSVPDVIPGATLNPAMEIKRPQLGNLR